MELERALHQISEIHGHLARSEVYRGYRPLPIAIAGGLAIAAAILQTSWWSSLSDFDLVRYWVIVGAVCGATSSSQLVFNYMFRDAEHSRRETRRVVGQFVPCLVVGLGLTWFLAPDPESVRYLPGLWAAVFCLGIFASRPYLPRAIGWVGGWYFACSIVLLGYAKASGAPPALGMGITFGLGQMFAAGVLWLNVERHEHA